MSGKWTTMIEQAGDESIGAALVRLAKAASGVHMFEVARVARDQADAGGTGGRQSSGMSLRPVDASPEVRP